MASKNKRKSPEDILADTANVIREVYIEERRNLHASQTGMPSYYAPGKHWDGGEPKPHQPGKYTEPIWPKIAKFVLDFSVDPEKYVRTQFRLRAANAAILQPNMLTTQVAMAKYRQASSENFTREMLREEFEQQKLALTLAIARYNDFPGWTENERHCSMISDSTVHITPLMRFCVANSLGITRIADYYYDDAQRQYLWQPDDYDKIWKGWLPEFFTTAARKLRRQTLQLDLKNAEVLRKVKGKYPRAEDQNREDYR
jgi:hypothetical protein